MTITGLLVRTPASLSGSCAGRACLHRELRVRLWRAPQERVTGALRSPLEVDPF